MLAALKQGVEDGGSLGAAHRAQGLEGLHIGSQLVASVRNGGERSSVETPTLWYVALAESLDAPLATLDLRLTRASVPACRFLSPRIGSSPPKA